MLVESDFQREYGLNLTRTLARMTWRRFSTLLRGLGPNSACATRAQVRAYKRKDPDNVETITDPDVAHKTFLNLFG
jgi:hypothetical protein